MRDEASAGDPPGDDDEHEWEGRRLCPDGACVGVVNRDGVCGTCGKVDPDFDAGAAARRAADGARDLRRGGEDDGGGGAGDDDHGDEEDEKDGGGASAGGAAAGGAAAGRGGGEREGEDEWQNRKLCEDGACVGVVIAGRCNACGRTG